ncbi:CHAT domain-containing protein [Microcoleus sp. D2_18a_D3]|uniref:CHAT domain-containing protein n=1 Tax=Microcoleus sp. D2_18a_D3 TaxID=3055330 RepID=UPI002FCF7B7F
MAKGFGPKKTPPATKRQKAYFKLIQALLNCPSGRELKILGNHAHLIDAGLVEMMAMVATILVADKELTRAKFLIGWAVILTQELGLNNNFFSVEPTICSQENFLRQWDSIQEQTRFRLFFQLLDAISESRRNFQTVDQRIVPEINVVLEANQAQLDEHFVKVLRYHSSAILSEAPPAGKKGIAARLMMLSYCIHDFKKGNEANNLEIAIAGYEIAVTVLTYEAFPEQWAACQNSLGNAYHRRLKGDRAENLERSIACCQNALQVLTRESRPIMWAEIQKNLAIAYGNRIRGDRLENAELARIACCTAMEVYTREAMPEAWAQLQNNLGLIYRDRICGDKAENLEQAIACYQNALLFRTREEFPQLWAQTQINLASAYRHRIHGDPVENVEKAIAANLEALQVYTQDIFPADWAGVQTNLGNAYVHRRKGDRNENLEMAIVAHQSALKVFNPDEFPREWAMAQMNLGKCYFMVESHEKAIACYRLALTVCTPTAFPFECSGAGETLGKIGFAIKDWKLAIEGYGIAIEAVETRRTWATSEFRRQEILEEAIDIYPNIVQACINNKQLDKAVEYVERSRSKRLVDLMASNDLYSSAEIPAEIQQYLQDFERLQQQIDQERGRNQPSKDFDNSKLDNSRAALAAYNQTIADLEAEKLLIWEQLRRLDPVLAGQIRVNPLKFPSIQQLIDKPTTAIISFYTTVSDTFIFVVRQNEISLQSCAGLGFEDLHEWIFKNWLGQYVEDKDSWKEELVEMLAEIAKLLNLNDLLLWHLEGISELIIVPHFALHQIPFAALPIGDNRYLGDKFLIRYAPSCQVLSR